MTPATASLGVFGGSGFYAFLDDVEQVQVQTPYGAPSGPVAVGTLGDRQVAFLPRHGTDHTVPPHRVNYRANLWAMRELGVERILGPCAAGSLQPTVRPGDLVVLDQLVDRTSGRRDTFFDGPVPGHVSLADPYCAEVSELLVQVGRAQGLTVHDAGTVVVISGPRFATRAESRWYRSAGWDAINMTQYPEAALARELGICYSGLALITDYDTGLEGVDGIAPVSMTQVFEVLRSNVALTRDLLRAALPEIPAVRKCACAAAAADGPFRRK